MNLIPQTSVTNRLPLVTGMLVAFIGLLVMLGWYTHNLTFIQLYETWAPMDYNAALGLFLCGVGLIGASIGSWRVSFFCSLVVMSIAALSLAEYLVPMRLNIDELLMSDYLTDAGASPGRLHPNVAGALFVSGLMLTSIGYGLLRQAQSYAFANLLGILVSLFGLLSLFGYFSAIDTTSSWYWISVMPPHVALGFTLLGFATAIIRWPDDIQDNVDVRRLQSIVITYVSVGVLVTMVFSAAIGMLPLYEVLQSGAEGLAAQTGVNNAHELVQSVHARIQSSMQRQLALTAIATLLLSYIGGFGVWLLLRPLTGRILMRAGALEKMIQKATGELEVSVRKLERSNQELDQYAHVASHDLQAPLHGIAGFAQMIEQQYGELLGPEGRKYITYITSGAHEMQDMVQGLLEISRMNNTTQPLKPVMMDETVKQAESHLASEIEQSGTMIRYPKMPQINGDQTQLIQLFQNLFANAIKFRKPGVRPEIAVTAGRDGAFWKFSVRDNGIGIEPANREKIFEIFHRLHTQSEYPGTGIGLSLCKKIVERHGGKIWVEAHPSGGSVFVFTLPAVTTTVTAATAVAAPRVSTDNGFRRRIGDFVETASHVS